MSDVIPAPPGFTKESWTTFARDGVLVIEDALDTAQVEALRAVVEKQKEITAMNVVQLHPAFTELIDHPAHIGYVYDVYGEMLKLLRSEYFQRPPRQEIRNKWHIDGPRSLPFEVFSPALPLRVKVGYWLTPLSDDDMGNLVYLPGSHHSPYLDEYHTHERNPAERQLRVRPGAMTLMWSGLWHRVAENNGDLTRLNMFLEYGPSWVVTSDREHCAPGWLASLSRNRRILMREYDHPNRQVKPLDEDFPLFAPRDGEPDLQQDIYRDLVPLSLRKRTTWAEQQVAP
jgi:ectoine hydroxylase